MYIERQMSGALRCVMGKYLPVHGMTAKPEKDQNGRNLRLG